jgi:hypothetical protein
MIVQFYYIRDKFTRRVIPETPMGRGGTHVEPVEPDMRSKSTTPRLFHNEVAANRFLTQWAKGKVTFNKTRKRDSEPMYSVKSMARDLSRMEVRPVEVELK